MFVMREMEQSNFILECTSPFKLKADSDKQAVVFLIKYSHVDKCQKNQLLVYYVLTTLWRPNCY
jgi:hypothetical protein